MAASSCSRRSWLRAFSKTSTGVLAVSLMAGSVGSGSRGKRDYQAGPRQARAEALRQGAVRVASRRSAVGRAADLRADGVPQPREEPLVRARRGRVLHRRARRRGGRPRSAPRSTTAGTSTRAAATRCSASSRPPRTPRSPRRCSGRRASGRASKGRSRILGPMDFTTNDEIGILIEGYERRPMILENWHPPYYRELIEAEGFGKAMDVQMWELQFGDLKEGETLRSLDPRRRREGAARRRDRDPQHPPAQHGRTRCARFREVYNEAWGSNWGFVPTTDAEVEFQAKTAQAGDRRGLGLHRRKGRRGRSAPPSPCPTSTRRWRS